jgi:hypothetical protein
MSKRGYPKKFLALLKSVKAKRARIVIDHILKHGHISTEEIEQYGYKHPPRAVRDVREHGIPIEMHRVQSSEGRSIAAYRFGDPSQARGDKLAGRTVLPKELKKDLIARSGCKCAICLQVYEDRYLQIDHRVPYQVRGEIRNAERHAEHFMLLCGSCNRAKSWSCEHCINWRQDRLVGVCQACYWANPEGYRHVALRKIRRLDLVWTDEEVKLYEALERMAQSEKVPMPGYVKAILARYVES